VQSAETATPVGVIATTGDVTEPTPFVPKRHPVGGVRKPTKAELRKLAKAQPRFRGALQPAWTEFMTMADRMITDSKQGLTPENFDGTLYFLLRKYIKFKNIRGREKSAFETLARTEFSVIKAQLVLAQKEALEKIAAAKEAGEHGVIIK
jgi:hypothetical protein